MKVPFLFLLCFSLICFGENLGQVISKDANGEMKIYTYDEYNAIFGTNLKAVNNSSPRPSVGSKNDCKAAFIYDFCKDVYRRQNFYDVEICRDDNRYHTPFSPYDNTQKNFDKILSLKDKKFNRELKRITEEKLVKYQNCLYCKKYEY